MPSYTKAEPQVVWEDTHTLVLYKPASWLCEVKNSIEENRHLIPPREASVEALVRSRNREHLIHFIMHKFGNQQDFLLASIEGGLPFRWGLVHRLDVDTSGLVLVGKTRIGFNHLKASLHCHAVRKEYICLVHGRLENDKGVIEKPIATSKSGRYAFISEKYGHWARTFYHVVGEYFLGDQCFALIRVEIQTGRTHQIRVHMSSLGHPLAGDTKYGSTVHFYTPRIFLHAERIEFSTIDGVRKSVMVPLPEDLTHILNNAWLQHSVD